VFSDEAANVSTATVTEERKSDGRKSRKRKHHDGTEDAPSGECSRTGSSLLELFDGLCTFLRGSLSLYMQDVYASHVVRAVLQVLSAQQVDDVMVHGRRHAARQPQQQQQHRHSHTGLSSSDCLYTSSLQCCDSVGLMIEKTSQLSSIFWFLMRTSLKVKVKVRGHEGQKTAFFGPFSSLHAVYV